MLQSLWLANRFLGTSDQFSGSWDRIHSVQLPIYTHWFRLTLVWLDRNWLDIFMCKGTLKLAIHFRQLSVDIAFSPDPSPPYTCTIDRACMCSILEECRRLRLDTPGNSSSSVKTKCCRLGEKKKGKKSTTWHSISWDGANVEKS